jgi:hypothetical protein
MMNEQAVASTPDDHPNRGGRLNNLGTALLSRFEITRSIDDLNRAIRIIEQALAFTPEDHSDRVGILNNLESVLQSRFEMTGSMNDLNQAIAMREQAVASGGSPVLTMRRGDMTRGRSNEQCRIN